MRQSDEEREQIGARIRTERERQGLTREKFSELCDSSVSYIADLELGKTGVGWDKLKAICGVLGVSSDFLLFGYCSDRPAVQRIADLLASQDDAAVAGIERLIRDVLQMIDD